jgi:hypothetical protein
LHELLVDFDAERPAAAVLSHLEGVVRPVNV